MRSVRVALVTMGLLGCVGSGAYAQQASPIPLKRMTVQGDFAVSEGTAAIERRAAPGQCFASHAQ